MVQSKKTVGEYYRSEEGGDITVYGGRRETSVALSVVIPLYNEEKTIREVIERIPYTHDCEIIVVDDGSTDGSVQQVIESYRRVKVLRHHENRGYGSAILNGFQHASGDIIITLDSDGQHNPEEIPRLIAPIMAGEADVVVGSRYLGASDYKVPLHTRMGELFIKIFMNILYNRKIGNNQSGFRAFTREAAQAFTNMVFSEFALCTEMLLRAAYLNLRIREVPITINKRRHGSSYVKLARIFLSISSCLLLYFLKRIRIGRLVPSFLYDRASHTFVKYLKSFF